MIPSLVQYTHCLASWLRMASVSFAFGLVRWSRDGESRLEIDRENAF